MPTLSKNDFLKGLKKSGVIGTDQLIEWVKSTDLETPQELAGKLVKDKLLTKWQAKFLMTGRTRLDIGSYRLLERIQRDELGDRFLALHTSLARKVEIQVLPAAISKDKIRFDKFKKQASMTATLDHPNLVHVYDIDQEGGRYFLVTEHVEGESLAERSDSEITPATVARLTREVLLGLVHAHENSVVHGSILPSDLVFTKRDEIKLNHIAISPLRNATESSDEKSPTEKDDFIALAKLSLSKLSKIPESDRNESFVELTKVIKSFPNGDKASIQETIGKLEQFVVEPSDDDPLGIDLGARSSGGFDSPAPTELAKKPRKPKKENEDGEQDEEEPVPAKIGVLATFWQTNPVAFIATAVVLGAALIGGSVFGAMSMLARPSSIAERAPEVQNELPKTSNTSLIQKEREKAAKAAEEDNTIADEMRAKIDELVAGESTPIVDPPKTWKVPQGTYKDLRTTRQITKKRFNVPAETSLIPEMENENGGIRVKFTVGNKPQQTAWLSADEVYDAGLPKIEGTGGGLPVAPNADNAINKTQSPQNTAAVSTDMPGGTHKPPVADAAVSNQPKAYLPPENLDEINGVGKVTKDLFYQAGITRFEQIANSTPEEIQKIFADTNVAKYTKIEDYNKWIAEAKQHAGMPSEGMTTSGSPTTAKPPANTTAKTGITEPLKKFPRETQLPDVTDLNEFAIAPLVIRKTHLLGAEILSEEGIAKQKLIFELTRGDKASGDKSKEQKQKWLIGVKRRESEDPDNFAEFRKSEDKFLFKWLPEAEKHRYAEVLRNCSVRLTLPDETQTICSLRKPIKIPPIQLSKDNLEDKFEFAIPAMPNLETLAVEVLPPRIKQTEINVINSRIQKGIPAEIWLKKNDKTGFLRIYVAGDIKPGKLKLQTNLVFWNQQSDVYKPITSIDGLASLANQLNRQKNATTQVYNQKKGDNKFPKYKKEELEKNMNRAAAKVELMQEYGAILEKLFEQPISIRVYSKLGKNQLQLVVTDPKMERTETKKKGRR